MRVEERRGQVDVGRDMDGEIVQSDRTIRLSGFNIERAGWEISDIGCQNWSCQEEHVDSREEWQTKGRRTKGWLMKHKSQEKGEVGETIRCWHPEKKKRVSGKPTGNWTMAINVHPCWEKHCTALQKPPEAVFVLLSNLNFSTEEPQPLEDPLRYCNRIVTFVFLHSFNIKSWLYEAVHYLNSWTFN